MKQKNVKTGNSDAHTVAVATTEPSLTDSGQLNEQFLAEVTTIRLAVAKILSRKKRKQKRQSELDVACAGKEAVWKAIHKNRQRKREERADEDQ